MIGPWDIALLVFLVLLFFRAKKLPELGRGLRELRRGLNEDD